MFKVEFETWRAGRPEWAALLRAIKSGAPADELRRLGTEAGADENELIGLAQFRRQALLSETAAKAFPSAKKRLAALDGEIAALRARAAAATPAEFANALAELSAAEVLRQRFFAGEFLPAQQGAEHARLAKEQDII